MIHYTTIEQSKKLVELGLNTKTADMYYFRDPTPAGDIMHPTFIIVDEHLRSRLPEYDKGDIPCWSLGELLELMPHTICNETGCATLRIHKDSIYHVFYKTSSRIGEMWCSKVNLIDAVFIMICWLLENNYIKKEK